MAVDCMACVEQIEGPVQECIKEVGYDDGIVACVEEAIGAGVLTSSLQILTSLGHLFITATKPPYSLKTLTHLLTSATCLSCNTL